MTALIPAAVTGASSQLLVNPCAQLRPFLGSAPSMTLLPKIAASNPTHTSKLRRQDIATHATRRQGLISTPLSTHQGQACSAAAAGQGLLRSTNRSAVGVTTSGWREQAELEAAAVEELDDAGKALRIIMDGARSHGKLDLTDFRLQALPEEVWDIDGLEVSCLHTIIATSKPVTICEPVSPRFGVRASFVTASERGHLQMYRSGPKC